jgi:glycosyltransferase involved in cell wall biosynthesis
MITRNQASTAQSAPFRSIENAGESECEGPSLSSDQSTPNRWSGHRPVQEGQSPTQCSVALLTGGDDKPYVVGLATALTSKGITVDLIGSDDLEVADLVNLEGLRFLNLRQDQRPEANLISKTRRILRYYLRLIHYAATAEPRVFHILWNNKFELFDRTILLIYYKMCGKRIVFTAHNVNMRKRDGKDSWPNRISLKIQYRLVDHIFVHTEKMRSELLSDFDVPDRKVSIIPFGINNTVPNTKLTAREAKKRLGIAFSSKTVLFFGQIAAYKGLEYLVEAFEKLVRTEEDYHLVIAGRPKRGYERYWEDIRSTIPLKGLAGRITQRIEHIPDEKVELYFKASDVLILPYTAIFQSGVLFLSYSFGLPVIAADVGTLKEEISEGETGLVFRSRDSIDLARIIGQYFESELFSELESRRPAIRRYANERYSWDEVAAKTTMIYSGLLER